MCGLQVRNGTAHSVNYFSFAVYNRSLFDLLLLFIDHLLISAVNFVVSLQLQFQYFFLVVN